MTPPTPAGSRTQPGDEPQTATGRKVIAIYGPALIDDVLGIEQEAATRAGAPPAPAIDVGEALRLVDTVIFDLPIGNDVTYSRGYSAGVAAARASLREALSDRLTLAGGAGDETDLLREALDALETMPLCALGHAVETRRKLRAALDPAPRDVYEPRYGASQPAAGEGERQAVEQWVELFQAHSRGEDLTPIFTRHVEAASERIRAALAEPAPAEVGEP